MEGSCVKWRGAVTVSGGGELSQVEKHSARLVYAHEHSIINYPAACRCVPIRVPARRAYACKCTASGTARRPCGTRARRGAGTNFSSMPAQSLGQAWAK